MNPSLFLECFGGGIGEPSAGPQALLRLKQPSFIRHPNHLRQQPNRSCLRRPTILSATSNFLCLWFCNCLLGVRLARSQKEAPNKRSNEKKSLSFSNVYPFKRNSLLSLKPSKIERKRSTWYLFHPKPWGLSFHKKKQRSN